MDIVEPPFSSEDRDRLDALGNPAGSVTTLGDLIARRMATGAEAIAYHFLDASDSVEISWAALFDRASALAGRLARVAVPGDRIVVTAGAGIDYIVALFACFGGGFVAVPCAPFRSARHVDTLRAIVADCSPAAILTDQDRGLQESLPATPVLTIAGAPDGAPPPGWPYRARPTDIAVLQYTSGSTGRPKGVMVTHANLLDNLGRQSERYGISAAIRAVIWLPPFHDMGLSAGVLQPLAFGFPILLMSPQYAMQHPLRWLQAIDDFDATISGGPPFAYAACTARLAATPSIDLDLSRLEVAFLGAEPIRPGVLRAFADAFAPHGFRPDAFLASYGLAEATLIVTGRRGGIATHRVRGREETLCGPPVEAHRIVIVDPATGRARAEGEEGEVWVAGPGVAAGYWRAPGESEATFGARLAGGDTRFLRTGDLGCLIGGELVVSGRLKDIIIVAGRNLAAGDIEETMRDAGGERLRHAVVTAIAYEDAGLERLAAVIEQSRTRPLDADAVAQLRSALGTAVATRFGVRLDDIAVVRFGTLPRTSSGKVRRHLCGPVFESNRSNRREPDHAE